MLALKKKLLSTSKIKQKTHHMQKLCTPDCQNFKEITRLTVSKWIRKNIILYHMLQYGAILIRNELKIDLYRSKTY